MKLPKTFALAFLVLSCAGCATPDAGGFRIDDLPMYGQPGITRPPELQQADADFIKQAAAGFGGDRKRASLAWDAQAEKYMDEDDLDYAMRRYNQSWLLDPDSYLPYWGFGRVLLQQDKTDQAIGFFEKSLQLIHDDYQKPALLSDTANAYSYAARSLPPEKADDRARLFKQADQYYAQSLAMDATYTYVLRRWAMSLYQEGDYAQAWQKVKQARAAGAKPLPDDFLKQLSAKMSEPPG